jgi:tetratricopeptide (TPR) repeat protein
MMVKPKEIWRCKSAYTDESGQKMETADTFLVCIVTEPAEIQGKTFVRIQPLSQEIAYRTQEDVLISDTSVTGFPFIIETWNEQPVLTSVLDDKIGELPELFRELPEQNDYTDEQLEFRKKEVRRTAFLRQSVLSVLTSEDGSQENGHSSSVVNLRIVKGMALAAVFFGVIFLVWQPFNLSRQAYFEKHASVFPNQLNIQDSQEELLRGEQIGVKGFNTSESELILKAMEEYEARSFETAVEIFDKVPDIRNKNHEVLYYYALSELFAGSDSEAIEKLKSLSRSDEFAFKTDAMYYLAMAYARRGDEAQARSVIKKLQEEAPDYLNDKPDLLKDLRWF